MDFDFSEFPGMPDQPDYTRQELQNLYQDAWNLGLLSDRTIKNLFSQVLSWYDKNLHAHLKEIIEQRKFENSLSPTVLSRHLPSYEEASDGEIYLGRCVGNNHPYHISFKDRHILVCGTTDSGKTTTFSILQKASIHQDFPFVAISRKKDSRRIAALYPDKVGSMKANTNSIRKNRVLESV